MVRTDFSLKDKVVVVTGGTGILGEAFVDGIAEASGAVGILGRNEKVAEARAKKIRDNGGKAIALIADVTDEQQVMRTCEKMLSQFGKIDGLVNGAGGNMPQAVLQ